MKMNVGGQGACSNTKRFKLELARTISVRWLGHASAVQPAATRHPVHNFFLFFHTFVFFSIENDTKPCGVSGSSMGTSGDRESENFSSSGVFVGTRIEE